MSEEEFDIRKESEELVKRVERYVKNVNELYDEVVGKRKRMLQFPLKTYVDDDFRENLLKHSGKMIYPEEKNPAHFCMNGCGKFLGFRGFCSKECHDKHYDSNLDAQDIVNSVGGEKNVRKKST